VFAVGSRCDENPVSPFIDKRAKQPVFPSYSCPGTDLRKVVDNRLTKQIGFPTVPDSVVFQVVKEGEKVDVCTYFSASEKQQAIS
jgi:hypothetical protein